MGHAEQIRNYIVENMLFGDGEDLDLDASFTAEGIIDSTGILELTMFLEEEFDIHIEDHELNPENLDSIVNIDRFLQHKLKLETQEIA